MWPGSQVRLRPGFIVACVKLPRMVRGGFIESMNVTCNGTLAASDRACVRSLFSARSGQEFGRLAHRVRTGQDFVTRVAKRLGWTSEEEIYARQALRKSVERLRGRLA